MAVLGFLMYRYPQSWAKWNARLAQKELRRFPKTTGVHEATRSILHDSRGVLIGKYALLESRACRAEMTVDSK